MGDGFSGGISDDESYLTMHWAKPLDRGACQKAIEVLAHVLKWPIPTSFVRLTCSPGIQFRGFFRVVLGLLPTTSYISCEDHTSRKWGTP